MDKGKSWARKTCKYFNTCGERFNCKGCLGYEKIGGKNEINQNRSTVYREGRSI